MKPRYRGLIIPSLAMVIVLIFGLCLMVSLAQEKPKDIPVKPATVDVPFSASDAVEINKLRVLREDTDRKISEILTTYGGEGEVLLDGHGNYVGIRKTVKKP